MCKKYVILYVCGHTKDIEASPCSLQPTPIHPHQIAQAGFPETVLPPGFFLNHFTKLTDPLDDQFMWSAEALVQIATQSPTGTWGCENGIEICAQKPPMKGRGAGACEQCKVKGWWGEGMSAQELEEYVRKNGGEVFGEREREERKWAELVEREELRERKVERINEEYRKEYGKGLWD